MENVTNLRDHDLLVGLNGKVDRMGDDIKELKNSSSTIYDNHEKRIRTIEDLAKSYDPAAIAKDVREHSKWIEDYTASKNTIILVASIIGAISGFILSVINGVWPFIGK